MTKKTNYCENCLWFDKCSCETSCEYYSPADTDEQENLATSEYKADLHIRHELYSIQIAEQS